MHLFSAPSDSRYIHKGNGFQFSYLITPLHANVLVISYDLQSKNILSHRVQANVKNTDEEISYTYVRLVCNDVAYNHS